MEAILFIDDGDSVIHVNSKGVFDHTSSKRFSTKDQIGLMFSDRVPPISLSKVKVVWSTTKDKEILILSRKVLASILVSPGFLLFQYCHSSERRLNIYLQQEQRMQHIRGSSGLIQTSIKEFTVFYFLKRVVTILILFITN